MLFCSSFPFPRTHFIDEECLKQRKHREYFHTFKILTDVIRFYAFCVKKKERNSMMLKIFYMKFLRNYRRDSFHKLLIFNFLEKSSYRGGISLACDLQALIIYFNAVIWKSFYFLLKLKYRILRWNNVSSRINFGFDVNFQIENAVLRTLKYCSLHCR